MISYLKSIWNKFKTSKISSKIIVLLLILIYISIYVVTLVKVDYESISPGALSLSANNVDIIWESDDETNVMAPKRARIYTVSVFSNRPISKMQYFLAKRSNQITLHKHDEDSLTKTDQIAQGVVMKNNSVINSLIVAYENAIKTNPNIEFSYEFAGIVINTISPFTSDKLKIGDIIKKVNDKRVTLENYRTILKEIDSGSSCEISPTPITLTLDRDKEEIEVTVTKTFIDGECKLGIGVEPTFTLNRESTIPSFKINPARSIGPSGGLMQTLSIYNSLTETDITKGLIVAGTGTVDYLGRAGAIGGVREKLLTVQAAGVDVFFLPKANEKEGIKHYQAIKKPKFELVIVENFSDILNYLAEQEAK